MVALAHTAVLTVHVKSKKFKVSFDVDTAKEKGTWEETYQVPERSSDLTFLPTLAKQLMQHRNSSYRLLLLLGLSTLE